MTDKFRKGDILVCKYTDRDIVEFIEQAKAIIVERGGLTSHAAIVGLNFGIPTIVGAERCNKYTKGWRYSNCRCSYRCSI